MIKSLIEDLAYDRITLSQGLTRAKIIAFKIDNITFQDWLKKELEGYSVDEPLPECRRIKCDVKATISNGYQEKTLSVNLENTLELKEIIAFNNEIRSISGIEENYLVLANTQVGFIDFEPGLVKLLEKSLQVKQNYRMYVTRAGQEINKLQLKNIVDLTKQKLIDTLLQLDKEFPDLNNLNMTKENNDKVQNIITNNIYGSNNPLNVAAGHKVEQNDFTYNLSSNFSELQNLGVEKKQIEELKIIVEENKNDTSGLKAKSMKWLGTVAASVAAKGLADHIPAITDFVHHLIK